MTNKDFTELEIEAMAEDFAEECKASLEGAEVVNLEHVTFDGSGFAEVAYMGRLWNIIPSGRVTLFAPEIDVIFWEELEALLDDIWIQSSEGDMTDMFCYRYLADDWEDLTPEQQSRFVDYS